MVALFKRTLAVEVNRPDNSVMTSLPSRKRLISSRMTFYFKRVFPIFWFGFLVTFMGLSLLSNLSEIDKAIFLIAPIVMAGFGYFFMKALLWDLADQVFDCGDHLLIMKGGKSERIQLSEIVNVNYVTLMNPQRVTLAIRNQAGKSHREIAFSPKTVWWPFAKDRTILELIDRIDFARSHR